MTATSKLLPCPFCGSEAESDTMQSFRRMRDGAMSLAVAIYCTKCSAQVTMCRDDYPVYAPEDLLAILTEAWNNRQPQDTPEVRQSIFDWGQAHGYTLAKTEIDDLLNRIEKARQ